MSTLPPDALPAAPAEDDPGAGAGGSFGVGALSRVGGALPAAPRVVSGCAAGQPKKAAGLFALASRATSCVTCTTEVTTPGTRTAGSATLVEAVTGTDVLVGIAGAGPEVDRVAVGDRIFVGWVGEAMSGATSVAFVTGASALVTGAIAVVTGASVDGVIFATVSVRMALGPSEDLGAEPTSCGAPAATLSIVGATFFAVWTTGATAVSRGPVLTGVEATFATVCCTGAAALWTGAVAPWRGAGAVAFWTGAELVALVAVCWTGAAALGAGAGAGDEVAFTAVCWTGVVAF